MFEWVMGPIDERLKMYKRLKTWQTFKDLAKLKGGRFSALKSGTAAQLPLVHARFEEFWPMRRL